MKRKETHLYGKTEGNVWSCLVNLTSFLLLVNLFSSFNGGNEEILRCDN